MTDHSTTARPATGLRLALAALGIAALIAGCGGNSGGGGSGNNTSRDESMQHSKTGGVSGTTGSTSGGTNSSGGSSGGSGGSGSGSSGGGSSGGGCWVAPAVVVAAQGVAAAVAGPRSTSSRDGCRGRRAKARRPWRQVGTT